MTRAYADEVLKCLINSTAQDVAETLRRTDDRVAGLVERRMACDVDGSQYHPVVRGLDAIAMQKGQTP
jgi:hypothetical protein